MKYLWTLLLWMTMFNIVDEGGGSADDDEDDRGDDVGEDKDPDDKDDKDDKDPDDKDDKDSDDKDDKESGIMIPKSRLDFKNEKLKQTTAALEAAQAEIAAYNANKDPGEQIAPDLNQQLGKINEAIAKAVDENDGKEVAKLQAMSQRLLMDHMSAIASSTSQQSSYAATEQLKLDELIDTLEANYTILDQESDDFDADISEEVVDTYDTLLRSGKYSKPDAMTKAVTLVLGAPKVVVDEETGKRKTNIDKNLKAAGKQPPDGSDKGMDSDKAGLNTEEIDAGRLSEEEFDALPETTKARMRGDLL